MEGNIFSFNWTILLQMVNFIIFMFVMDKILFKPLLKVMSERDTEIQSFLAEAKALKEKAEEFLKEYERIISEAKTRAKEIISQAVAEAKAEREKELAKAQEEAKKRVEKAKQEIWATVEQEKKKIEAKVEELAQEIVEKLTKAA